MKVSSFGLAVVALTATLFAPHVSARPVKVKAGGTETQMILMCPTCNGPIACTQVGDYTFAFSVDLDDTKRGVAKLKARVARATGESVRNGKVTISLLMPNHGHGFQPLKTKSLGNGNYTATASQVSMPGPWSAEVALTAGNGDTLKQAFTFTIEPPHGSRK